MNNVSSLLGVILAVGQTRRMDGIDKYGISVGGKTLINHISERLSPQVTNLIINAQDPNILEGFKVVPDQESHLGPIGGIYSALKYALENDYRKIVTVPCDTPFIPYDFVEKLLGIKDSSCVIACSGGRLHPVLGLWDVSIINDVKTSIESGEYTLMKLIKKLDYIECRWTENPDPFFNINTREDIKVAESRFIL